MKIHENITMQVEKLVDIRCDKCDQSTKREHNYEHAQIYADWGYESEQDGASYALHICEKCFNEIISSFIRKEPTFGPLL